MPEFTRNEMAGIISNMGLRFMKDYPTIAETLQIVAAASSSGQEPMLLQAISGYTEKQQHLKRAVGMALSDQQGNMN